MTTWSVDHEWLRDLLSLAEWQEPSRSFSYSQGSEEGSAARTTSVFMEPTHGTWRHFVATREACRYWQTCKEENRATGSLWTMTLRTAPIRHWQLGGL